MAERLFLFNSVNGKLNIKEYYVPVKWLKRYLFFHFRRYKSFKGMYTSIESERIYSKAKSRKVILRESVLNG